MPDFLFIEHISRELQALLRLGVTPARTLARKGGQVVGSEMNTQEFYCYWAGDQFKQKINAQHSQSLTEQAREQLVRASAQIEDFSVLEWIEQCNGKIVFLDHRFMAPGFLISLDALCSGFISGRYRTLTGSGQAGDADNRHILLERPLYEYTKTMLSTAGTFVFKAGALLSHFCVYAAAKGLPCVVSRPANTGAVNPSHEEG